MTFPAMVAVTLRLYTPGLTKLKDVWVEAVFIFVATTKVETAAPLSVSLRETTPVLLKL